VGRGDLDLEINKKYQTKLLLESLLHSMEFKIKRKHGIQVGFLVSRILWFGRRELAAGLYRDCFLTMFTNKFECTVKFGVRFAIWPVSGISISDFSFEWNSLIAFAAEGSDIKVQT